MSNQLLKCGNCGAPLNSLNVYCTYCNRWNVDPNDPASPPAMPPQAAQPAPTAATPPPAAPAPAAPVAAPPPAAPPPAAPAPVAARAPATPAAPAKASNAGARKPVSVEAHALNASRAKAFASAAKEHGDNRSFAKAASAWAHRREAEPSEEEEGLLASVEATLAAAYYVTTADDHDALDEDEYGALLDAFGELLEGVPDEDELETLIEEWDAAIDDDEEGFLAWVAETLPSSAERRTAFELAVTVSAHDEELTEDEEAALEALAEAFEIDPRQAERLTERALERLEEG